MLKKEGYEKKILGLLELRQEALSSGGLGKSHPHIVKIDKLIILLKD
jgi:hypothetical protein